MRWQGLVAWGTTCVLLGATQGCVRRLSCDMSDARAGGTLSCPVSGWTDRGFELEIPASWDGKALLPLVVAFHGGGGNRLSAARVTCPTGDTTEAGCFSQVARVAGFAVLRPDGTGSRPLRNVRTWNAGGGTNGFNCASGPACKSGVDDMRYFDDLLAEVAALVPIDDKRIHLTGLSNGGAISHRIACERAERVASFVAVGGSNQHAGTGGACAALVPMMQIHGTDDPCWSYAQDARSCIEGDRAGVKIGAQESIDGWRARNGCAGEGMSVELLDRDPGDGTRITRVTYPGCRAAVELLRVQGGGHTWPSGYQYLGEGTIGRVTRDVGSDLIVEFFRAHPKG